MEENDIDITLADNRLTISGRREEERREEADRYYAYERTFGTFTRTFTLPPGVDAENVQAEFKNGVLTIKVPKRAENQPKHIKVGGERGEKAKA